MTLPPHIDGLQMLHPSDDDKLDDLRAHYCDVCGYIKPAGTGDDRDFDATPKESKP